MRMLSLVWGLLAFLCISVSSFLGIEWLDQVIIPFAGIGVLLGIFALTMTKNPERGNAIAGVILSMVAAVIGVIKIAMGGLTV